MSAIRDLLEALEAGGEAAKVIAEVDRRMREFFTNNNQVHFTVTKPLAQYLDSVLTFRHKKNDKDPGMGMARRKLNIIYDSLLDWYSWSIPGDDSKDGKVRYLESLWDAMAPIEKTLEPFVAKAQAGGGVAHQIETERAIYQNRAGMARKRFEEAVRAIEDVLGSIRGWRRRALKGRLHVAFVGAQEMKAQGKYVQARDEMLVRMTPKVLGREEGYGSFRYILVHELGHRYEVMGGAPPPGAVQKTTRYSYTDSLAGDEAFAELFALGHFGIRRDARSDWGVALDNFEREMAR